MTSLVSLANDIFAADLNELSTFRDQIELRAEVQQKAKEREEKIREKEERAKRLLQEQQQESSALAGEDQHDANKKSLRGGQKPPQASSLSSLSPSTTKRSGSASKKVSARGKNKNLSLQDATEDLDGENEKNEIPPIYNPKTDLTGVVSDARVDPFLDLIRALDSHAEQVAKSNAPYLQWMKQRMSFLNSRSNLVGGTQPIPEDVLGDHEQEAEVEGGALAPPPLAIPLLAFSRAHADELKQKYSYSPPRGLLQAGKVTREEIAKMRSDNQDQQLERKLQSHGAGETWKEAGFKSSSASSSSPTNNNNKSNHNDDEAHSVFTTNTKSTKQKRKIGLPTDAFSNAAGSKTKSTRRSSIGGGSNLNQDTSDSDDKGGISRGGSFTMDRSMSDYTELYVQETEGASKRREARLRQVDKFHATMRAAVEFSTQKLVFADCLPGETYKQQFRLWNRSSDLRRFKIQPGSHEALKKAKVAGYSNNYTFGVTAENQEGSENNDKTASNAPQGTLAKNASSSSNVPHQSEYNAKDSERDGIEAYEIPQVEVTVISPKDYSPDKAIAPGTSIIVEVSVRPHWSAFETADCSIAVSHVRDVNSKDRDKNDFSQWHCEELPVTVEICQPQLQLTGPCVQTFTSSTCQQNDEIDESSTTVHHCSLFKLPTCFIGNSVTEKVSIKNSGARANFSIRVEPRVSPFTIEPTYLHLNKDEEATLTVTYRPRQELSSSASNIIQDKILLTFEGTLVPSESEQDDKASRRKGRRRVYLHNVDVSGFATDACVFVSTIGVNSANQLAMKQHKGENAIGCVNIDDAVVGFAAWRPVTVQNDSDLDIPVVFDTEITSGHTSDVVVLEIKPRNAVVPARGSVVVDLMLSTKKDIVPQQQQQQKQNSIKSPTSTNQMFLSNTGSNNNNNNNNQKQEQETASTISGRFLVFVDKNSIVPDIAIQRAHERRFQSLSSIPSRNPREINNNNIAANQNTFFVEEFDLVSTPSRPALSFTPTKIDMSDVEALTNQTNVCDAILRNDGAGELQFFIVSQSAAKMYQTKKDRSLTVSNNNNANRRQSGPANLFLQQTTDGTDSSDFDEDAGDEETNVYKHLAKQHKSQQRSRQLQQQQQGSTTATNNITSFEKSVVGHGFEDEGGLEWWAVPASGVIAPGVELRVSIRYNARRAGSVFADLMAYSPLLETDRSPPLTLLAKGRGPTLQSNVASLEFGSVTYGAESECRFNLFNPSENAVYVSLHDAMLKVDDRDKTNNDSHLVDDSDEQHLHQDSDASLSAFQRAVRARLVITPSHCTLHPRQTAIITVYLRAVNPGKNEDFVRVAVQDGTDLLIPFSGSVIVPELLISPSTISLGSSVDRDVVVPCSFTISNPSCIEVPFEVVEVDDLRGICKIDLIGYSSSILAGALDVPVKFTVTFTQEKDTPVSVMFALVSPVLQTPVLCRIKSNAVCQPTVALAVTLPGQALFCQSTEGFVSSLLKNIVEDALINVDNVTLISHKNTNEEFYDEREQNNLKKKLQFVAPFVDPITLTGSIDKGLPYCAMDFELIIKNPTGCVFPCSANPIRFPSAGLQNNINSNNILQRNGDDDYDGNGYMMQYISGNGKVNNNGKKKQLAHLTPAPPTSSNNHHNALTASGAGRSTRLPKMASPPKNDKRSNAPSTGRSNNNNNAIIPALSSQTAGKTFFCRAEDGTDARDRVRDELLAAASALVQTGREVAIDIASKDDKLVDCVLNGFDVHPLNVRCLATIPGVFQDKIRLNFGTGVPSTEIPVTFRVSGCPVVVDPSTSSMVCDANSGVNTLQLPSVVAGMRSVKRTLQITSRCPRDLRLDCRITVTGSSVGSSLLPADIFGGEAAISTTLFSKEGGGPANVMANSWASVSPSTVTLGALQSTQITIEYKPPKDAKIAIWNGVLHIDSTIVASNFNDKFLIAEFYELHSDEYPAQRSLNPIAVQEKVASSNNNGGDGNNNNNNTNTTTIVKGVSKLPLRVPMISRHGVVEDGILLHRQAAQLLATASTGSPKSPTNSNNAKNIPSATRRQQKSRDEMTDSSDEENYQDEATMRIIKTSPTTKSNGGDVRQKEEARKSLIAKIRKERPNSANESDSFDASAHEAAVEETTLVLQYLRRRYEELRQFTAGGFILPTQLNLYVKHLRPILDVDPQPLVRFPKCFVPPSIPHSAIGVIKNETNNNSQSKKGYHVSNTKNNNTNNASGVLPSNIASVRLQNNGITPIEARFYMNPQTAKIFKIVAFTRRHGDARPKLAANKYETNPIETGTTTTTSHAAENNNNNKILDEGEFSSSLSWVSGSFKMVPQEIVDVDVAVVNANCPALDRLLASFSSSSSDNNNNHSSSSSPPPPEAFEAAPYITLVGEIELRFSNGESQKIDLSSHVFVPKVSLVQEHVEFLPTVEVSLGRGQPTLSRRITLVNASPCPAAFEFTPIISGENSNLVSGRTGISVVTSTSNANNNNNQSRSITQNNNNNHEDPELEVSSSALYQATTGGARQGIAKNTAKALGKLVTNREIVSGSEDTKQPKSTLARRDITLKAAVNSVDIVALTKKRMLRQQSGDNDDNDSDDDDDDEDGAIYDTGRFHFSAAVGHLPPASAAGVPSRTEIDIFFEPFASSLFEAKFKVEVEGGVGSTLSVRAQSRVTEV